MVGYAVTSPSSNYLDGCDDIIACLLLGNLYGTGAIIRPIIHDLWYHNKRVKCKDCIKYIYIDIYRLLHGTASW